MAGRSKDVNIDTRTDIQTLRHKDTQIRWLTLDHTDNTETRKLVVCFCDKGEAYCQHAEWGAFIVCVRVCLRPCGVWVSVYLCLGALSVCSCYVEIVMCVCALSVSSCVCVIVSPRVVSVIVRPCVVCVFVCLCACVFVSLCIRVCMSSCFNCIIVSLCLCVVCVMSEYSCLLRFSRVLVSGG